MTYVILANCDSFTNTNRENFFRQLLNGVACVFITVEELDKINFNEEIQAGHQFLILIHVTPWNSPENLINAMRTWHLTLMGCSHFLLYSGGGVSEDWFEAIESSEFSPKIKILRDNFVTDVNSSVARRLKKLVDLFVITVTTGSFSEYDKFDINDKTGPTRHLIALDILLQGYLMVWSPTCFGDDLLSSAQSNINTDKGRKETRYSNPEAQHLFRCGIKHPWNTAVDNPCPVEPDHKGYFWFDACLPDVELGSWEDLFYDFNTSQVANLKQLWSIIRALSLENNAANTQLRRYGSQAEITALIQKAHQEFVELMNLTIYLEATKSFEHERALLNHNLVENEFLKPFGFKSEGESESRTRADAAWNTNALPDEDESPELFNKIKCVKDALTAWPKIKGAILSFLERGPAENQIQWTQKGIELKITITNHVNKMDVFVTDFYSIEENQREGRFKQFYTNANKLKEGIRDLKLPAESNPPFGEYLEPISRPPKV